MCTNDIFTDVYPDGRKHEYQKSKPCDHAVRTGHSCSHPSVFRHPPTTLQYGEPSPHFMLHPSQMPPTPRQTPRTSTPVVYASGNESDRSRKSGASDNKRSSGVYVNGQKVLDLNRKRQTRNERIVIVDAPPTPRTPPMQFSMPHTAPPSPNAANMPHFQYNIVDAAHLAPRESLRRPVIVDERPRPHVQIEVIDHGHRRHHSNDSRHSHSSSAVSDEERRRRRHEAREREREDRQRAEDEVRRQKQLARIALANEAIKRRPAVPIPPPPPGAPKLQRASTGYARPAVEMAVPAMDKKRERELVEAVRRLQVDEKMLADAQRREKRKEQEEEEAQRRRLMERMMPRRRATVGPGARRHRVLYDDGMYRWE